MKLLPSILALLLAAALGCGGKVYLSPGSGGSGGGGGGGGASSSSGTGNASSSIASTGAGDDCAALGAAYEGALDEASKCNACIDFDGCSGGPVFTDVCGCPVGTNTAQFDAIDEAKDAFAAFSAAGCPFLDCGKPCFGGSFWFCQPGANGSCDGSCSSK